MPPRPSTVLNPLTPWVQQRQLQEAINRLVGALTDRTVTPITVRGQFKYTFGTPAANKILVSDADGDATWASTLVSPVLTTPEINDTSADHQYVFAVSELTADRTVTLPLLIAADTFVFADHIQTLAGKTLASPTFTGTVIFPDSGRWNSTGIYPGNQTTHYISGGASGIGIDVAAVRPLTVLGAAIATQFISGGTDNLSNYGAFEFMRRTATNNNGVGISLCLGISTDASFVQEYAYIGCFSEDNVAATGIDGGILFSTMLAGTRTQSARVFASGGWNIGVPTGLDKGAGTLNANAVYDDNTLLTDWLFDLYYDGKVSEGSKSNWKGQPLYTLEMVRKTTSAERRLPWMPTRATFEKERSLGGMVTRLWEGQEYQQTYLFGLDDLVASQAQRITTLETEVAQLKARP